MQPEHAPLLHAMTRLVLDPAAPASLDAAPRAWLAAQGVEADDAEQLAALGSRRLLVYRRHVRTSLTRAVRQQIPRTAARLGSAFEGWVRGWIDDEGPRSAYFRDMAFELVAWAAPRWAADPSVAPYLPDLARHELAYFEVACAEDAPISASVDIELDLRVAFASSVRVVRFAHAVHELSEALDATDVPREAATALLVYRDAEDDVRFLELTPLAAAIVERLLAGEALGPSVSGAAAALEATLDAGVTGGTAALLEDLVARGAVLGGKPW